MTSSAYELGRQVGMAKQAGPMAWLGRKAIMPAVKGVTKPIEWLLGKLPGETMAGAAESVGGYRTGLDKAMREPSAKLFKGRGKKQKLEELVGKQRTYGGVGTAAVGIPALATVLASISGGRRRRAEEAMQAELAASAAAKEASVKSAMGHGYRNLATNPILHPFQALGRNVGSPIIRGVTKPLEGLSPALKAYREGLSKDTEASLGRFTGKKPSTKGRKKPVKSHAPEARKRMARIGMGTAAVGAAAGAGAGVAGGVAHKKKKEREGKEERKEKREEKKEAQLGTPFMDGFLLRCATTGLTEKQTADAIEKAAQAEGRVGEECKSFLERLAACDE